MFLVLETRDAIALEKHWQVRGSYLKTVAVIDFLPQFTGRMVPAPVAFDSVRVASGSGARWAIFVWSLKLGQPHKSDTCFPRLFPRVVLLIFVGGLCILAF